MSTRVLFFMISAVRRSEQFVRDGLISSWGFEREHDKIRWTLYAAGPADAELCVQRITTTRVVDQINLPPDQLAGMVAAEMIETLRSS